MVVFASISKPVFLCIIPDLSSILFFLLPNKRKTLVSRLTSVSVYPDPILYPENKVYPKETK